MKTEPTFIIEAVRAVLIVLTSFGVLLTVEQADAIVLAVGALVALGSVGLAFWNRHQVYSPARVEKIVAEAVASGDATVPPPPGA